MTSVSEFLRGPLPDHDKVRAAQRYRSAALTALASVVSRSASLLVLFLGVHLTAPYLGAERFGMWVTLSSLSAVLGFLDLGIGNALTNRVAEANTKSQEELAKVIAGGLSLLLVLAIAVGALLSLLCHFLPPSWLIRDIPDRSIGEFRATAFTFCVLFSTNIFVGGAQRVFHGMQRGSVVHLCTAGATVGSCGALYLATRDHAPVHVLLAITMGLPLLTAVPLLSILTRERLLSLGSIKSIRLKRQKELLHAGSLFLALQVGTMIAWGADSLIVASYLGASSVATFVVVQRLFLLVSQPLNILNSPLWAAYADAHSRGEKTFMLRTLSKSLIGTLLLSLAGGLMLVAFFDKALYFWTGATITAPLKLVVLFCIWTILESTGHAFAMFLNGAGIIRPQVIVVSCFVSLAIPLKLLMATKYGVEGVVSATVIAYTLSTVLLYATAFRGHIRSVLR